MVKAKRGGNSCWSVPAFTPLKPRHSALSTFPARTRVQVSSQAGWGFPASFSCLGPGSCCSQRELSQGNFKCVRSSVLQTAEPGLNSSRHNQSSQNRGSSESKALLCSWNQEHKTLSKALSNNAARAQELFQFLLSSLPCPMSDANQQHDIYTPSPGRCLLTMQPGQSFHPPHSFCPDKSKNIRRSTGIMKLTGKSSAGNLAKLNSSCLVEKLFQEIYALQKEILVCSGKSNILVSTFSPENSAGLSWKIQVM